MVNAYCNIYYLFFLFFLSRLVGVANYSMSALVWQALARVRRVYATPNAQLTPAHGWTQAGPALVSIVAVMISHACNAKTCHGRTAGYMQTKQQGKKKKKLPSMYVCMWSGYAVSTCLLI